MTKKTLLEVAGWYGMAAILLAYGLVSFQAIQSDGIVYQLLNLTGAAGLAGISLSKRATQPALLNIIWAAIALVAVLSILI